MWGMEQNSAAHMWLRRRGRWIVKLFLAKKDKTVVFVFMVQFLYRCVTSARGQAHFLLLFPAFMRSGCSNVPSIQTCSNLTLYKAVNESKSATLSPFVCQSGAMLSTNGPQWSLSNCHQAAILLRLPQTPCQLPKTAYRNNHVNGDNLLLLTSTHTPTRTLTGPLPPSEGP